LQRAVGLAGAIAALTFLVACGGTSNDGGATTPPVTGDETPSLAVSPTPGNASSPRRPPDPESSGANGQSMPLDVNPCTLLTRAEAQEIVGAAVSKPELGSQGPTCIYQVRRIDDSITIALQRGSLPTVTESGHDVIRTDVAGRKAVCVDSGGLKLLVAVSSGSVLTVGAPCPIATQLAAKALRRLD
jgi:Protein of unknown function (DUF3558)